MDGIIQRIDKYMGNPSFFWVPILALAGILVIAALVGWVNGWKTSLYFFGWNLVGVLVGIFTAPLILEQFGSYHYVKIVTSVAKNLSSILVIIVILLVLNLLAFLFYWIFRKELKFTMKENKLVEHSNVWHRFGGAGIAIISAAPLAIFLADTSAMMSNENAYTKTLDKLTGWITGNKFKGSDDIRVLATNIEEVENLVKAISGATTDGEWSSPEKMKETKAGLQKILNTDFSKNIDSIYKSIGDSGLVDGLDDNTLKKVNDEDIKDIPAFGVKISKTRRNQLVSSLSKLFINNGGREAVEAKKIANEIADRLVAKENTH